MTNNPITELYVDNGNEFIAIDPKTVARAVKDQTNESEVQKFIDGGIKGWDEVKTGNEFVAASFVHENFNNLENKYDILDSNSMRFIGKWDATEQVDFSGIELPVKRGYVYKIIGTETTIDGIKFTPGNFIVIKRYVSKPGTIDISDVEIIGAGGNGGLPVDHLILDAFETKADLNNYVGGLPNCIVIVANDEDYHGYLSFYNYLEDELAYNQEVNTYEELMSIVTLEVIPQFQYDLDSTSNIITLNTYIDSLLDVPAPRVNYIEYGYIVKVITDESREDLTTYYKWNGKEWVYIGNTASKWYYMFSHIDPISLEDANRLINEVASFRNDLNNRVTYNDFYNQMDYMYNVHNNDIRRIENEIAGIDVDNFATKNDLNSYTTKTYADQTYATKEEISLIPQFDIQVVSELPTEDISTTTIYLISADSSSLEDLYNEYIYVNNNWELIGSGKIDSLTWGNITGTISDSIDLQNQFNTKIDKYETFPNASKNYENQIAQYVGATNQTYTNAYFYKCIENGYIPDSITFTSNPGVETVVSITPEDFVAFITPWCEGRSFGPSDVTHGNIGIYSSTQYAITIETDDTFAHGVFTIAELETAGFTFTPPFGSQKGATFVCSIGQKDYAWTQINVQPSGSSGNAQWGDITGTLSNQTDLQDALDNKQDTLISGTNIKTINGNSILGSGNLEVGGVLPELATVATTGKYVDLLNKPTIPNSVSELSDANNYINVMNTTSVILANVATSGDYNDLTNIPAIPVLVQSDWNVTDTSSMAFILNKPTIPDGVIVDQTYNALSNNAQSGIAVASAIVNKVNNTDLANVATSGDYNDLTNKPTIPSSVQSDWNVTDTSSMAFILNKPTIPTTVAELSDSSNYISTNNTILVNTITLSNVATSGDYNDLTNKPTIPPSIVVDQTYNALSNNAQSGIAVANAISTKQDILTAGNNITITNNVISANTGISNVSWGDIGGTLNNQTDLQNALNNKSKVSIVNWNASTTTDLDTLIINKLTKDEYDDLVENDDVNDDELYMVTDVDTDYVKPSDLTSILNRLDDLERRVTDLENRIN